MVRFLKGRIVDRVCGLICRPKVYQDCILGLPVQLILAGLPYAKIQDVVHAIAFVGLIKHQ